MVFTFSILLVSLFKLSVFILYPFAWNCFCGWAISAKGYGVLID
jgi:hypothetical protein